MRIISRHLCAQITALGLMSGMASAVDLTAIPAHTGWKITCPSHAPDWVVAFEPAGAKIRIADAQANLQPAQSVGSNVTSSTVNSTTFALSNGVVGKITLLTHPTCSDGHIYDAAPFSIDILNGLSNASPATGNTACCVLEPY